MLLVLISFVCILVTLDCALVSAGVVDFIVSNGGGAHLLSDHHLCPLHFWSSHVWKLLHVNVSWGLLLLIVIVVCILHLLRRLSQMDSCFINALLLIGFNSDVTID